MLEMCDCVFLCVCVYVCVCVRAWCVCVMRVWCVCVSVSVSVLCYFIMFIIKYKKNVWCVLCTHAHPLTLTHSHTSHTHLSHTKHTHSHTHTQTHTQTHLSSVVNCVDTNSTQFNADWCLFTSIWRLGSKKIHLASNCMFMVVYGKFTPI